LFVGGVRQAAYAGVVFSCFGLLVTIFADFSKINWIILYFLINRLRQAFALILFYKQGGVDLKTRYMKAT
jgi:hypothetical protein